MKSKCINDGTKEWRLPSGLLHREDGPAIEWNNGDKSWYINGRLHREDDPAVVWGHGGTKEWWLNDLRHREYDPPIEWSDGEKAWFLNGIEYTEQEYKHKTRSRKLIKLLK